MSKGNKGTKDDKANMKPKTVHKSGQDIPKEIPPRQGFLALSDRVL